MIKLISDKVACYLCKDEDCKDNYGLYEYAVYIILSSLFHIATIIVLGLCFNLLVESLMFYFSFISIRKFAGGYHAKTPVRCYVFSVISTVFILVVMKIILVVDSLLIMYVLLSLDLICVILICMLSPIDTDNNPLNNREKKVYKTISVVASITIFGVSYVLMLFSLSNIGASFIFGMFMSTLVLILGAVLRN